MNCSTGKDLEQFEQSPALAYVTYEYGITWEIFLLISFPQRQKAVHDILLQVRH
jgi:hypothetical protein